MKWPEAKRWLKEHAWIQPPASAAPLGPGVYHYQRLQSEWPTRFHLRVDPDGGGLLLANAAEAAYLSPVGVEMVHQVLEDTPDETILDGVRQRYQGASSAEMAADLAGIHAMVADLSEPGDNYPVTNLTDHPAGRGRVLAAPFRADVVQGDPETIRDLLNRLWEVGIPHTTFLANPARPPAELVRLVEAAEDLGMIAGLRALASWLSPDVIREAALAGLDHLDVVWVAEDASTHEAVTAPGDWEAAGAAFAQCHDLELAPVAEVPLFAGNASAIRDLMAALARRSVTNLSFYALACPNDDTTAQAAGALPARGVVSVAVAITEAAEEGQTRYLWAPPVRFDPRRSLADHVRAGPRAVGDVSVRVEADGSVFPARGPRQCTGNLLTQTWEEIWNHECFARYRGRLEQPERCPDCPDLPLCRADCPKDPRAWSDDTMLEGGGPR
jgi:radical SAM protein with 4Fe4S-binding SPASM domain